MELDCDSSFHMRCPDGSFRCFVPPVPLADLLPEIPDGGTGDYRRLKSPLVSRTEIRLRLASSLSGRPACCQTAYTQNLFDQYPVKPCLTSIRSSAV